MTSTKIECTVSGTGLVWRFGLPKIYSKSVKVIVWRQFTSICPQTQNLWLKQLFFNMSKEINRNQEFLTKIFFDRGSLRWNTWTRRETFKTRGNIKKCEVEGCSRAKVWNSRAFEKNNTICGYILYKLHDETRILKFFVPQVIILILFARGI